jgi:uncharacterized repeat protein (TIGR03833 family)
MSRRHHNNRRDGRSNGKRSNANAQLVGSAVSVVQKHHQGTDILTSGIVSEILTNSDFHPRGIKVRLVDGTVGRIAIASSSQQTQTRTQNNNYDYSTTTEDFEQEDRPRRQPASLADFMENVVGPQAPLPPRQEEIQMNLPSSSSHSTEKEWACSACTFVNSGLLPECELCQTARPN